MEQLLILSGKGGTGKTTTAAAFISFAKAQAFADCDVDAPNLHLVTQRDDFPQERQFLGGEKAEIDVGRCTQCGRCATHCRFDAILTSKGTYAVNPLACEGCGLCEAICPAGAVTLYEDVAGTLRFYPTAPTFSTAKLKMGRGNSGKLVAEVKGQLKTAPPTVPLSIIDGSPGIGCPVIASISGVDLVLIVAEPSLSGRHDMERILKTCAHFETKVAVCVNKWDVCPQYSEEIQQYCTTEHIPFVGTIPYDPQASVAINSGVSVAQMDCPAKWALETVYQKTIDLMKV